VPQPLRHRVPLHSVKRYSNYKIENVGKKVFLNANTLIFKRNLSWKGFEVDASSGSWSSARLPSTGERIKHLSLQQPQGWISIYLE
jgi:hypothetical protein